MAYEKWLEHVAEAQKRAAERLGVDVSTFKRPRKPVIPGYNDQEQEEAATATTVAEPAAAATPEPEAVAAPVTEPAAAVEAPAPAEAPAPSPAAERIAQAKARAAAKKAGDGAEAPPRPKPAARPTPAPRPAPAPAPQVETGREGMNRREFLTYAWGAALALLALEGGYVTFKFMYPRFREGEFGGKFPIGPAADLPEPTAPPKGYSDGKFWLVNTDVGPKALYMVCTHLGCLYKWVEANNRFECPCHGSKFTREGYYIEGPAPRSLDQFVIYIQKGEEVLSQTTETETDIIPPEVPDPSAEVVVDTGKRLLGKPASLSPARAIKA